MEVLIAQFVTEVPSLPMVLLPTAPSAPMGQAPITKEAQVPQIVHPVGNINSCFCKVRYLFSGTFEQDMF